MLTSAECREMAKQKLIQAEHEPQRRTRLLAAAQGWLALENELRRLEQTRSSYPESSHAEKPSNRCRRARAAKS
jgi:hypothetical protein